MLERSRLEALARSSGRPLPPAFLIAGDEPLLVQEACDAVLAAAREAGFDEREVLHAEAGFEWGRILAASANLSLFATNRIIDLRVPDATFGREGSEVLVAYLDRPAPDTLLLIRSGRLDPRQRNSAWYRALAETAVIVTAWPISAAELPRWLEQRLRGAGLKLTRDALHALSLRVEGNLLAAAQEVQKLSLQDLPQPITLDALLGVLEDAAHYDAFELIDAALAGDAPRVVRVVQTLRQTGVAIFAVLGAWTAQLRRLRAGDRLPPQRERVAEGFLRRIGGRSGLDRLLAATALIDAQGKGEVPGDPWRSLEELLLRTASVRLVPAPGPERLGGLGLLRPPP